MAHNQSIVYNQSITYIKIWYTFRIGYLNKNIFIFIIVLKYRHKINNKKIKITLEYKKININK